MEHPDDLQDRVRAIAIDVRTRRRNLKLRQVDLDVYAGVPSGTCERVERKRVSHRGLPPDSPLTASVLATLAELELAPPPPTLGRSKIARRRVDPDAAPVEREAFTAEVRAKLCTRRSVWITQKGCDGLQGQPECAGCKGIRYKKAPAKNIVASYKPPEPEI